MTYLVKDLINPSFCRFGRIDEVLRSVLGYVGGDVVVVFGGEGLEFVVLENEVSRRDSFGLGHELVSIGRFVDEVNPVLLLMPTCCSFREFSHLEEVSILFGVVDLVEELAVRLWGLPVRMDSVDVEDAFISTAESSVELDDSVEVRLSVEV